MKKILIIDDDESLTYSLQKAFSKQYYVMTANCAKSGLDLLAAEPDTGLVFLDYKLGEENGLDVLERMKKDGYSQPVIFMTAYGTSDTVLQAAKLGSVDFLVKPVSPDDFIQAVQTYYCAPAEKCMQGFTSVPEFNPDNKLAGISRAIRDVLKLAALASGSDAPVFITGESGTGKDLIANIIHDNSDRSEEPFLAINCAAIPQELLESELFGYEKGAFSGAVSAKKGLLEATNGGTVFLDEISEMSMDLQAKLLRFLQNGTIQRIGELKETKLDVRVVSATNKNIESLTNNGNFRFDLYHRLSVINIFIPPLRERKEDIRDIALHLIAGYCVKHGKKITCIDEKLLDNLTGQSWRGNVRELENRIREAIILSKNNYLTVDDFSFNAYPDNAETEDLFSYFSGKYPEDVFAKSIEECERELIIGALAKFDGKLSKAASWLNVSRVTLNSKIKKYNITVEGV